MTRRPHSRIVAPVAAALLALGLAGCSGADPTPSNSPESSSSADAPVDSASAEPTTDWSAVPATCDTVLTAEAYAKLEADGLETRTPTLFDPIAVDLQDEGGLVCSWGRPNSDNVVDVVQLPVGDDEAEWGGALAAAGYTQGDDPVAGSYRGQPDAANGISPVVVIGSGTVTYVSTPVYAEFLLPAS
ncbi:hypothetical protein [Agromyces sp. M3QZ16-3]|uniref:hypothetical protein n=1 Tax=Agromyces sp. M3QZ16-3 TaxID=3447585 RepID=UPI003F693B4C